jgi:hypothetical protein
MYTVHVAHVKVVQCSYLGTETCPYSTTGSGHDVLLQTLHHGASSFDVQAAQVRVVAYSTAVSLIGAACALRAAAAAAGPANWQLNAWPAKLDCRFQMCLAHLLTQGLAIA